MYDIIIVGAGAAGLTSAIYSCRKNLKTLVIKGPHPGGETSLTNNIENYPGYEKGSGLELMDIFERQAKKFGSEFLEDSVVKISKKNKNFIIKLESKKELESKAVILAFGRKRRKLDIPGEDKFLGRGLSTCTICLPPEEKIIANNSIKNINEININEKVLSLDGSYQKVINNVNRTYNGKLIEIKTRHFTEPVKLTLNHPVLKIDLKKGKGEDYFNFKYSDPYWVDAGTLKKEDILLYPISKEVSDIKEIKISDFINLKVENGKVKNNIETHTSKRISNKIKISNEFLRLVGYYLSDGCLGDCEVNIDFNEKETEYVKDLKNIVKKVFQLNLIIIKKESVIRGVISSKIVSSLFEKLFSKYAHNKKIPHWMVLLPIKKQIEIIKGEWRGDGCTRDKDFCIVTNSKTLVYQLRDILLRLGLVPSIQIRKKENLKPGNINGRKIYFKHDKYHISLGGQNLKKMSELLGIKHPKLKTRKRICKHAWIKDNFVLLPIRKINYINYNGLVYNLSVENNTYVTRNFIVHNCDAPLFANKIVAVVGGGNSAVEGALELSNIAKKVYLIHRREEFRADEITVKELKKKKNVELVLNSTPLEIIGDNFVKSLKFQDLISKKEKTITIEGVFTEIGYDTDTTILIEGFVETNELGEIIVDQTCKTKTSGVFAAGDLTAIQYKQTVISAGMGAIAALEAHKYITDLERKK